MCLGVPGRITAVEEGLMRMGTVDFDGSSLEVCLAYVPEAGLGDYVLVHAGLRPEPSSTRTRPPRPSTSCTDELSRATNEPPTMAARGPADPSRPALRETRRFAWPPPARCCPVIGSPRRLRRRSRPGPTAPERRPGRPAPAASAPRQARRRPSNCCARPTASRARSLLCTHQGCNVRWRRGRGRLLLPLPRRQVRRRRQRRLRPARANPCASSRSTVTDDEVIVGG